MKAKGRMNSVDEIIELYKRDVDVTLLDECLKRTVEERLQALQDFSEAIANCERKQPVHVTNLRDLLRALGTTGVDFILVGGVAAAAHGSGRLTQDVDVASGSQ